MIIGCPKEIKNHEYRVGLIPDNTCSGLENVLTNSGYFTINCEAYSSYEFRFFKTDSYDESSSFDVYLKVFENKTVTAVRK